MQLLLCVYVCKCASVLPEVSPSVSLVKTKNKIQSPFSVCVCVFVCVGIRIAAIMRDLAPMARDCVMNFVDIRSTLEITFDALIYTDLNDNRSRHL